jgi:hypothetical protein
MKARKPSIIKESEIIMSTSIAYETIPSRPRTVMGIQTLWSFLALTFGLSWVPMTLFMLFADQLTPLIG